MDFAADTGTTLLNELPQLVTGATNIVTATHGQAARLPAGSVQITGQGIDQTQPPFDWMPVILGVGGLVLLSVIMSRK